MKHSYSIQTRPNHWHQSGTFETKEAAEAALISKLNIYYPKNWGLNLLGKYIILSGIDRNKVIGELK